MKLFSLILFASLIILTICCECKWTGCEGLLKYGEELCKWTYEFGNYTGETDDTDCDWDTTRVKCCKNSDCKWTGCEGTEIENQAVCDNYSFGTFSGQVNKDKCEINTTTRECCQSVCEFKI